VFRLLGKTATPVPGAIMAPVLSRLWRYRLTSFPTPELDHIRYVCMVDDSRAREVMGFRPRHGLEETVRAVLG
jgi:UDP-glucose 4-epimerase